MIKGRILQEESDTHYTGWGDPLSLLHLLALKCSEATHGFKVTIELVTSKHNLKDDLML